MGSSHGGQTREFVEEYSFRDGRRIYVLAEGRLINLVGRRRASGLGDGYELRQPGAFGRVHGEESQPRSRSASIRCRKALDKQVARMKLESMGVKIDRLTAEQEHYLASWSEGT